MNKVVYFYRKNGVNMDLTGMAYALAQSDVAKPSLFPFPFSFHLVLSLIAVVFFIFRFYQQKRPFQLIFAIAVPFSMLVWLSESKTLFYAVGIFELLFIIAAIVTSFIFKPAAAAPAAKIEVREAATEQKAPAAESDEADAEDEEEEEEEEETAPASEADEEEEDEED